MTAMTFDFSKIDVDTLYTYCERIFTMDKHSDLDLSLAKAELRPAIDAAAIHHPKFNQFQ
jgi:hypothetical protein